ncbi:BRO1-like domain-containing protein [Chlamydoabsidia padenii]|nr:BRO1-like domain-containing protein [Chlamydoabsidia padenii]
MIGSTNGNGLGSTSTGLTTTTSSSTSHLSTTTTTSTITTTTTASGAEIPPVVLSVPTKKSKPIRFGPALLPYIANAYAEDASLYEYDCQALDDMRSETIQLPEVLTISTIERLFMYYSQLVFLGTRFPLDVGLEYPWYPAFQQQNKKLVKRTNLNYEKANILFTIGAVYSQLGSTETRISTEGIRKACSYYQYAAGCFKYISREIIPDLRSTPPGDLAVPTLQVLISLMLAQAQECMWQKAVMEHMKHGTIARLAVKVADFFDAVLKEDKTTTGELPSDWLKHAQIKSAYFLAVAQYHKANECISMSKYGEEIARLRIAKVETSKALEGITASLGSNTNYTLTGGFGLMALLTSAPSALTGMVQPQSGFVDEVRNLMASIERDLLRAEKDNNVVYMESVPDFTQLAPILRSDMVKPMIPSDLVEPAYWKRTPNVEINRPLFESLVPFAVHQAASVYSDKKEWVVEHDIISKCKELQKEYKALMEQLNLPYSLDVVDPEHLPQSLLSCAEEVQHDGGGQALRDMLSKIQQMSMKNADLVEEGFNILEEENEGDDILRRQYGSLWTRPPSQQLTGTLLAQGAQYHDTLQAAMKADRIVRAKVTNWGKAIDVLSQPTQDLLDTLPNITKDDQQPLEHTQQCLELIQRLRNLIQDAQGDSKAQLQLIEDTQALGTSDEISTQLLAKADELTGGSPTVKIEPEQFGDVFTRELKKYEVMQGTALQLVNNFVDRRIKLEQVHGQFSMVISANPTAAKREKAIKNLEQAFTKFKEIRTNLVEGIKFYSQYTDTLTQFRDDCNSFAMARKMEATEISRNSGVIVRRK